MTEPDMPNSNPYEPMLPAEEVAPKGRNESASEFWWNFWTITAVATTAGVVLLFTLSTAVVLGLLCTSCSIIAGYRGYLAGRLVTQHPRLEDGLMQNSAAWFFLESLAIGFVGAIGCSIAFVCTCYPVSLTAVLAVSQPSLGGSYLFLVIPLISLLCFILTLWLLRKFLLFTLPKAPDNEPIDYDSQPS